VEIPSVVVSTEYEIPPMMPVSSVSTNVAVDEAVIPNDTLSLDISKSSGKLNIGAIKEYYGEYDYIAAHLGNGIGITINNLGTLDDTISEINVGAEIVEVPNFAQGFDTVHIVPTTAAVLPCDVYMHIHVGTKNIGKKAYIFKFNSVENKYELNGIFDVNEIGNVAIATNEMTDIMVLVQE
jgi:hypothetical protein